MVVVSDTSPVTNLLKIKQFEILRQVYGIVILPEMVYEELCRLPDQQIEIDAASWVFVQKAKNLELVRTLELELDEGESEAIALALEIKADFLIIDEVLGRKKAEALGLKIAGILGTLLKAKENGFIPEVKPLMDDLIGIAKFKIQPALYQRVMQAAGE